MLQSNPDIWAASTTRPGAAHRRTRACPTPRGGPWRSLWWGRGDSGFPRHFCDICHQFGPCGDPCQRLLGDVSQTFCDFSDICIFNINYGPNNGSFRQIYVCTLFPDVFEWKGSLPSLHHSQARPPRLVVLHARVRAHMRAFRLDGWFVRRNQT